MAEKSKIEANDKRFSSPRFDLGHMKELPKEKMRDETSASYYLPYLSVLKESSITCKCRVVFNGSSRTERDLICDEGTASLNDQLLKGSSLIPRIADMITSIREKPILVTADIEKFYRQVKIIEEHQDHLRIIWRKEPHHELKEYCMTRLPYGLASSGYLTCRIIKELAHQTKDKELARHLNESFYVDDACMTFSNLTEAQEMSQAEKNELDSAKLPLKKFLSNHKDALKLIPEEDHLQHLKDVSMPGATVKLLGLPYVIDEDCFTFDFKKPKQPITTKRQLLSFCNSLFDSIGLISPFILTLKLLLQNIWSDLKGWDEPIDLKTQAEVQDAVKDIELFNSIKVPRWIKLSPETISSTLVYFTDGSLLGYAVTCYSQIIDSNGFHVTNRLQEQSNIDKSSEKRM